MFDQAIAGMAGGGVYALVGVCVVLAYRVGAVINFSMTFVGALAAYITTDLVDHGMSPTTSVLIGILIGTAISGAQGVVMAVLFHEATVLVRTTVTIAMAISAFGITVLIYEDGVRSFTRLFQGISLTVGDTTVSGISLVAVGSAVVLGLLLWLVLGRTRFGAVLRAVASRPTTAELLGIRTRLLVLLVWTVCGALSSSAVILIAPTRSSIAGMAMVIAPALAAALVGRLTSFGLTIVGGIGLGMLESMTLAVDDPVPKYRSLVPFLVVVMALLWSQRKEQWDEAR